MKPRKCFDIFYLIASFLFSKFEYIWLFGFLLPAKTNHAIGHYRILLLQKLEIRFRKFNINNEQRKWKIVPLWQSKYSLQNFFYDIFQLKLFTMCISVIQN